MKETLNREPRLADAAFYTCWTDAIIRHTDCDNQGHVNNSVFATLFNDGRVDLFRRGAVSSLPKGAATVLVSLHIDFLAELAYPNNVRIGSAVLDLGRTSFTIGQGIFDQNGVCVGAALCVMVLLGADRRPTPWPDETRASLLQQSGELAGG